MTNINRRYAKTRTSPKPWHWYFDRLPKALRQHMAQCDHNWADEQVYNLWKGVHKHPKMPIAEIIALVEREEARMAYNWMEDV